LNSELTPFLPKELRVVDESSQIGSPVPDELEPIGSVSDVLAKAILKEMGIDLLEVDQDVLVLLEICNELLTSSFEQVA
jgi:hypothetical protein